LRKSYTNRKRFSVPPAPHRSKISNGSAVLSGIDGRSAPARRFKNLYQDYLKRTAGEHDELCKQLATLIVRREAIDAAMIRGEPINDFDLVRISSCINRTLARLQRLIGESEPEHERRRPLHDYLASREAAE